MKKRILAGVLSAATVLSLTTGLTGCKENGAAEPVFSNDGKKLRIACWNNEFREFVEGYYTAPEGITIEWIKTTNDGGAYQKNLDDMLAKNVNASADEKIDLFLAEADYIKKYSCSDLSLDLQSNDIGGKIISDTSNMYDYVINAGKDENGVLKAVSFQATPSALIVRRSIAKDVLDTDDPAEVQSKLDTWEKFEAVAADAKAKGYYMLGSSMDSYRVFMNGSDDCYIKDGKFALTPAFEQWFKQAETFDKNGYATKGKIWDNEKKNEMYKDGKMMCTFGPSWYYSFSMDGAKKESENNSYGDWMVVKGPQEHFWGGTWLLAANGTDNIDAVKDLMNKFCNDDAMAEKLIKGEGLKNLDDNGKPKTNPQFPNNKRIIEKYAADENYGNGILGGQNDIKILSEIVKNIKWDTKKHTAIDQTLNETLPEEIHQYTIGAEGVDTKEKALDNFYSKLAAVDQSITH